MYVSQHRDIHQQFSPEKFSTGIACFPYDDDNSTCRNLTLSAMSEQFQSKDERAEV